MNKSDQKRKFVRHSHNLPITFDLNSNSQLEAICKNLSEGGLYIEVPEAIFENNIIDLYNKKSELKIKLRIPNTDNYVEAVASPRWVSSSFRDGIYGMGMEFTKMPQQYKELLLSYLTDLSPESKIFTYITKAFLADVNVFGTTYFAKYFDWQGKARESFFELVPGHEQLVSSGLIFVTKNASVDYFQSVKLFDEVIIEVTTKKIKKASFELIFRYYIKRLMGTSKNDALAAIGKERICFVKPANGTRQIEVVPVPEPVRQTVLSTCESSI